MNLFEIIPRRTNKRKYHSTLYRDIGMVLLFVFLLPYVMACLWGHIGEEAAFFQRDEKEREWLDEKYEVYISGEWGGKRLSMQEYLIQKLEMTMPREEAGVIYESEALKAQAVLLRTELLGFFLAKEETKDDNDIVLQDDAFLYRGQDDVYTQEEEAVYREAVCATDGIYLSYEGEPVKAAYFPISNGKTRNADDVMPNSHYSYLISVECSQDIMAEDYQSHVDMPKEEYCRLVRDLLAVEGEADELLENLVFTYDSADYVAQVDCMGHTCSGERFRSAMGLNSASFSMEWGDNTVSFYVKGVGHGFGMSQYGANKSAALGETFDSILNYYFFQAELVKIE